MKKILSLLLIVSLLLCITACAKKPDGRYNIESMTMGDTTFSADQLKETGIEMYIVFNSDGTGALCYGSEEDRFTWTDSKLTNETGEEIEYTFDGTYITLVEGATTVVFK